VITKSQNAPQAVPFPPLLPKFQKSTNWPDPLDRQTYRIPSLPSEYESEKIHHACNISTIRQRGRYWWITEQIKLEDNITARKIKPVIGTFYCFLEEENRIGYNVFRQPLPGTDTNKESAILIFRYGNVLGYSEELGYHWIMRSVAFPKDHPDANISPYKMIDVIDRTLDYSQ